jgi:hypothetical protein
MDLTRAIEPKSDQLNADDLITGSRTIKITSVEVKDTEQQPVSIHFEGDNGKPYKPSKSMIRAMVQLWGKDGSKYVGKSLTLFRETSIKYAGVEVGGIYISHASDITEMERVLVTISRGKRKPIDIYPIVSKPAIKDINKAKEAIEKGTYTINQIKDMYELTEEQIKTLES